MRRNLGGCVLVLCALFVPVSEASTRDLTLDERIEAQRAIERVYFAHRAWPADNPSAKPAFEMAFSDRALAARVDDYVGKSVALQTTWSHPIAASDLQAELNRMARDTRDPGLLRELFDALGNDPFVIAETLARQNLAGTRLRDAFAREAGPSVSFEAWWMERKATARTELRAAGASFVLPEIGTGAAIAPTTPASRFGQTSVWTGNAMIVWGSESFANTGALYDPALDSWSPTSTGAGVPTGRGRHSAVWTGSEMIVWGGLTAGGETNTGARYVPATDTWTATSTGANCPSARQRHTAVWTGSQMIVFGGSAGSTFTNTGGLYDLLTDSWTTTSTGANVPSIRDQHTAVWTGTQMIVWGGSDAAARLSTGSRYTPATDSWTALPTTAAPTARNRHTAVWTGTQMIVWGGFAPPYLSSGSRYNPTINAWSATSPTNAPSIRGGHTAVWTGSEMVVFGGQNATVALDNGGRYNPTSNTWTAIAPVAGSPTARYGHTALFVDGEMLVWGGTSGSSTVDTGGRYKVFTSAWSDTATAAPGIRFHPRASARPIGGSAVFGVMARGDSPLTYRWRKGGVDMSDGPGVSGTTTDTLRFTAVQPSDAALYSVAVTNGSGTAISNDASLSVNGPQGGDIDVGFRKLPGFDSYTTNVVALSDGKVIVTGAFTSVYGAARGRIARLNADGSNDETFMHGLTGADSGISDVLVQPDGRILIAGNFISVHGVARRGIARLNPDGTLDTTFLNGLSGAGGNVNTMALSADGKIIAAGNFQSFNGSSDRNSIVRLNPDGSLDNTWLHGVGTGIPYSYVLATVIQPDGKILVGGRFDTCNGEPKGFMTRLNPDGSNDSKFLNGMAGADWEVSEMALLPTGKIMIGGTFGTVNGITTPGNARLNADGSVDAAQPASAIWPSDFVSQPDGKLIVVGSFSSIGGVPRNGIARFNADGSLDTSFQDGMSGISGASAFAVSLARNGQIAIAGSFETVNGAERNYVAKLNADGSLDTSFAHPSPVTKGTARQTLQLPDGRILMSGTFSMLDGVAVRGIARLLQDGSVDPTFHAALDDGSVSTFLRQPDGRLVIGGSFTSIGGATRNRIARLNADGSLDVTFQNGMTGLDLPPSALALQPDGRIVVAGSFTTVNGISRSDMARINADGSLDPSFQVAVEPPSDGYGPAIQALALQPDGKVIIAGEELNKVNGIARARAARLNSDGTLDATFVDPKIYAFGVFALALQPDGRIVIGGEFESVNGAPRNRVARINADGTLDTTFLNGLSGVTSASGFSFDPSVTSLALMGDGRVLVSGKFTHVNGTARGNLARLNPDGSVDTTFQNGMTGFDSRFAQASQITEQSDGRVLLSGWFGAVNLENTGPIARLYGAAPVAPAITTQPGSQVSHEGSCAVFQVAASGSPVDYRWRKGGVDLVESATIGGTKSATLTLTGVAAANAGSYDVVISNVLGTETSVPVTLTVNAVPACQIATCDAQLGSVLSAAPDGSACTDGNVCTTGDACGGGACVPGVPVPPPGEIAAVRVDGHSPSTLSWNDPGGAAFDVASSTLADLRTAGTTGATCLANDVATAGYSDTRPNPTAGNGYYYLVRAQSACGNGTYGTNSTGVPRAPAAACP